MPVKSAFNRTFVPVIVAIVLAVCASIALSAQDAVKPPEWVGIYSASGKVGLKWSKAPGVARYKVYRAVTSGRDYKTLTTTSDVSFIDAEVKPGETYYYVLKSVGMDGSESAYSDERHIKVPVSVGGIPVAPPEWIGALVEEKRIRLSWLPSPSSNTLAYNIYRSVEAGSGFQLIGSTQDTGFTDTDVMEGQAYYYALTTLDKDFKETRFSEIKKVVFELTAEEKAALPKKGAEPEALPEKIIAKPTKMVKFITRSKDEQPLKSPTDIDLDSSGHIFVTDSGNYCIQVYRPDGGWLRSIGGCGDEKGKFKKLLGIDVDESGYIYAADAFTGRLQKFTTEGELVMVVDMSKNVKAIATDLGLKEPVREFGIVKVVAGPGGRLYAVDNFNHCVVVYSSNGAYIKAFGGLGPDDGKFQGPTFAMLDKDGDLCVSDCFNARIQVFSSDGVFKRKFGSYGNILGTFSRPKGVCADDSGRIYVSDSMTHTVQVFDGSGGFLYILGDERGMQIDLGTPNGIVVDGKRRIYMVEKLLNRVQVRQIGDQ